MIVNPYEPPRAEPPAAGERGPRATLRSSLAYGAYAGGFVWATAGTATTAVCYFAAAILSGQPPIFYGVGGAVVGCFGGGLIGALVGSCFAWLVWREKKWAARRQLLAMTAMLAGWAVLLSIVAAVLPASSPPVVTGWAASLDDRELAAGAVIFVLAVTAIGAVPAGLWLWRLVERFVRSPETPAPAADSS